MPTKTPTYGQIKQALIEHGVNFKEMSGAATIGRPWDTDNPLEGHVHHHTSTSSATGDTGCPTLDWILTAFNKPAANAIIGRDGVVYICSWGSCWHSGLGGPWASRGLGEGNVGHFRLWGTEIDDPGVAATITAAQIESMGRLDAALMAVTGWDPYALVNHCDWTDAGQWLMDAHGNPDGPTGTYVGRKDDTLRQYYSANFWRANVKKYQAKAPIYVLNVPSVQPGQTNNAVRTVQKALNAVGVHVPVDGKFGANTQTAYRVYQSTILKWPAASCQGIPSKASLLGLANRTHLFKVI